MISVIIPTMWKPTHLKYQLPMLNDHPLIGEIILIDNDPTLKDEATCTLSKVNYVTFGHNIYPAPSWNHGWEIAKHDKLLIINDDVSFDPILVDAIYDYITEENGTITAKPESVTCPSDKCIVLQTRSTIDKVKVEPVVDLRYKAAIILGIHKKSYVKIPDEIRIYYNDHWLFKCCQKNTKSNFSISGCEIRTNMSSTVSHFRQITSEENSKFVEIFNKYGVPR